MTEGRFWLSRLLAAASPAAWAGHARYALGYLGYWSGDTEAAISELRAACRDAAASRTSTPRGR